MMQLSSPPLQNSCKSFQIMNDILLVIPFSSFYLFIFHCFDFSILAKQIRTISKTEKAKNYMICYGMHFYHVGSGKLDNQISKDGNEPPSIKLANHTKVVKPRPCANHTSGPISHETRHDEHALAFLTFFG